MFLSEPPKTNYDLNFRLMGIPVRVHPLFWLTGALLGLNPTDGDPKLLMMWVGVVFVSIVVHEMGHALAARSYGWAPWITLHVFGGLASYRPTYETRFSRLFISVAGPAAQLVFAGIIFLAVLAVPGLVRGDGGGVAVTAPLFSFLLVVNIVWALFNLLPVIPLDGGQIARELIGFRDPEGGTRKALWLSLFVAGGLAVLGLALWGDYFLAFFFGYMAYLNYSMIQQLYGAGYGGGFHGSSDGRGW